MLNERYCGHIIEMLDKEDVVFDAFYQRLKAFKRTDEYCNYNQIYLDFGICKQENEDSTHELCDYSDSFKKSDLEISLE